MKITPISYYVVIVLDSVGFKNKQITSSFDNGAYSKIQKITRHKECISNKCIDIFFTFILLVSWRSHETYFQLIIWYEIYCMVLHQSLLFSGGWCLSILSSLPHHHLGVIRSSIENLSTYVLERKNMRDKLLQSLCNL